MTTVIKKNISAKLVNGSNKIPVLHIIKSLGRGGAETLLPETLALHNQDKFEFHYIYFLPWKYQMVSSIEDKGGVVTCLSANNNFQIVRKILSIISYTKKHGIKLIHCHLPWAGIVSRIVGKLTSIPVVYTEHNKWERYHKLTYHLNKLSFGSQNRVIAVSGDVADSIKTHYKKAYPKVEIVLNGINTKKFSRLGFKGKNIRQELSIPEDAIVIGLTCVFRVQKRVECWLEIAKKIHNNFPDTHYIIAGDGVQKEKIFAKANQLETKGFVHFVGLQSEIRPYLQAMDIFMMTSEFEGLPIALLEAMSMECMPASTDAGGIPELVRDNINGIVVPKEDPLKLYNRLVPYLKNKEKIIETGREARKTVVNQFSMKKMVTEIESIYENILNHQP